MERDSYCGLRQRVFALKADLKPRQVTAQVQRYSLSFLNFISICIPRCISKLEKGTNRAIGYHFIIYKILRNIKRIFFPYTNSTNAPAGSYVVGIIAFPAVDVISAGIIQMGRIPFVDDGIFNFFKPGINSTCQGPSCFSIIYQLLGFGAVGSKCDPVVFPGVIINTLRNKPRIGPHFGGCSAGCIHSFLNREHFLLFWLKTCLKNQLIHLSIPVIVNELMNDCISCIYLFYQQLINI